MTPSERKDVDINTISIVQNEINQIPGIYFILSGSYGLAALRSDLPLEHNDIDATVYAQNVNMAVGNVDRAIVNSTKLSQVPNRFNITRDRLEYLIGDRYLELQFGELISAVTYPETVFSVRGKHRDYFVPTTIAKLHNSRGEYTTVRVKTLPYIIGTWAIRLSGFAMDQKRIPETRDFEQFKYLLMLGIEESLIEQAMECHPQFPDGVSGKSILGRAKRNLQTSS